LSSLLGLLLNLFFRFPVTSLAPFLMRWILLAFPPLPRNCGLLIRRTSGVLASFFKHPFLKQKVFHWSSSPLPGLFFLPLFPGAFLIQCVTPFSPGILFFFLLSFLVLFFRELFPFCFKWDLALFFFPRDPPIPHRVVLGLTLFVRLITLLIPHAVREALLRNFPFPPFLRPCHSVHISEFPLFLPPCRFPPCRPPFQSVAPRRSNFCGSVPKCFDFRSPLSFFVFPPSPYPFLLHRPSLLFGSLRALWGSPHRSSG